MGRKSSSSSGDGSMTVATVMGLRMIQCGRQTVPVVQPDGQVRQFSVPVRVADLLRLYPHHFVSHATAAPATAGRRCSSAILPLDAFLDTGSIYALRPLPRLFPSDAPPAPHPCSCFLPHDEGATGIAALKAEIRRHWSPSKISPDDGNPSSKLLPRRLWEPALEVISEDRVLLLPKDEETAASERENHKGKKLVSALNFMLRSNPSPSPSPSPSPADVASSSTSSPPRPSSS